MTNRPKRTIATLSDGGDSSAELNLWRACIEQHLRDACYDCERFLDGSRDRKTIKCRSKIFILADRARTWFKTPNESFDYVCDMAALDPSTVRKWAMKIIAEFNGCITVRKEANPQHTIRQLKRRYDDEHAARMDARDRKRLAPRGRADGAIIPTSQSPGPQSLLAGGGAGFQ